MERVPSRVLLLYAAIACTSVTSMIGFSPLPVAASRQALVGDALGGAVTATPVGTAVRDQRARRPAEPAEPADIRMEGEAERPPPAGVAGINMPQERSQSVPSYRARASRWRVFRSRSANQLALASLGSALGLLCLLILLRVLVFAAGPKAAEEVVAERLKFGTVANTLLPSILLAINLIGIAAVLWGLPQSSSRSAQ